MGKPRVTWLLPVRNAEQHLESTLISIAEQDYPNQSVYVWDNGSTDATPDLLRKWIGRELPGRVIGNTRIGKARALGKLVVDAQSDLLARIEVGYTAEPDRIQRQIDYLYEHRRVGVVGSQVMGPDGRTVITHHPADDAELRWALRFTNPVSHSSVMLRRSAVLEAGNYRDLSQGMMDYDLWARMGVIVQFGTIQMPLTRQRIGKATITPEQDLADRVRFEQTRDALIDRLLPGSDPNAARRLLHLIDDECMHVTADDLVRFRHVAMLSARACRYKPTYFTQTELFKQQVNALKARRFKSAALIRPVLPLIKRAGKLLHKPAPARKDGPAAA